MELRVCTWHNIGFTGVSQYFQGKAGKLRSKTLKHLQIVTFSLQVSEKHI